MSKKRSNDEINAEIRKLLSNYYNRRIAAISSIQLVDSLKKKNPYLLSANGINNFDFLMSEIVNQYLQISDSSIFGDAFFEPLAIFVSGGKKSVTEGVDIELHRIDSIELISVKSGVNIFNSSSKQKQNDHMTKALKIYQREHKRVIPIVGYCYGKKNSKSVSSQFVFQEIAGQEFWEKISGDSNLYKYIIECIEEHSEGSLKGLRNKLYEEISKLRSRWKDQASQVIDVNDDGFINWSKLVTEICSENKSSIKKQSRQSISAEEMKDIGKERIGIAAHVINSLSADKNLGRTKLAKIMFIIDAMTDLDLRTNYVREAAGPLDAKLIYDDSFGIEKLALMNKILTITKSGNSVKYKPTNELKKFVSSASGKWLNSRTTIDKIIKVFERLDTKQSEIVATAFACWNDLLSLNGSADDERVLDEFFNNWNSSKKRFSRVQVQKALIWMRQQGLIPTGKKALTKVILSSDVKDEENIPF